MTHKQIGKAIRKARGTRSIRNVAAAAGLSRHQVTAIENATTDYTIPTLIRLCDELGVTVTITTNDHA